MFSEFPEPVATTLGKSCLVAIPVAPRENGSTAGAGIQCHPPEDKGSSSSMAQHVFGVKRNFPNYNQVWFCIGKGEKTALFSLQALVLYGGHPFLCSSGHFLGPTLTQPMQQF